MTRVEEPFSNTPAISRIIASSFTIEPPMMAGIRGDMVPTSASRMPAPMPFRVSLRFTGAAGAAAPGMPSASTA